MFTQNHGQPPSIKISDVLKEFFRTVDIQIMITDLDTDVILYANEKMNKAYGVDYDPTGKRCWEAYQVGQVGRCESCPLNKARHDEGQTFEWERLSPQKDRWFRNTSSLVRVAGRLVHFEQGADITEVKNAHRAQRESEAYAQLMLDSTPLMCSLWNEGGQMIDCNKAALQYFQVNEKSDYIDHFLDLSPEIQPNGIPSKELAETYISKTLKSGRERFFWLYQTATGEPLPVETTLIRTLWHGEQRILAYSHDLREIFSEREKAQAATEYTQIMLDSTPLMCAVWGEDGKIIDANLETLRLLGLKDKKEFLENFYKFSPEFQADGSLSKDRVLATIKTAFQTGSAHIEWDYKAKNGELVPTNVMLIRVPWRGHYRVLSYSRDLRQVKKAENTVLRYNDLLKTANNVAVELMASSTENFAETVTRQLEVLGHAVGAERVHIWRNVARGSKVFHRQLYEWRHEDIASKVAVPFHQEVDYDQIPYFKETLFSMQVLNHPVREMPPIEKAYFSSRGIRTLLVIPLVIQGDLWGFLSVNFYANEVQATDFEISMLQTSGNMLASIITRNQTLLDLMAANQEARITSRLRAAVNDVATRLLSRETERFDHLLYSCLETLGTSAESTRVSIWRNFEDASGQLCCRRFARWTEGKSYEEECAATDTDVIDLASFIPEWNNDSPVHQPINLPLKQMSKALQNFPVLHNSKSVLLIPIEISDKFWGFVSYIYDGHETIANENEVGILRSGSAMLSSAIARHILEENLHEIELIAATDSLTGLLNRGGFLTQANALFANSKQCAGPVCMMFLDIDFFKKINDQYGHAFGDIVLRRFAEILRSSVSPRDLCGRYGGEEFVVMLTECTREVAAKVSERIMASLYNTRFKQHPDFTFTASIGLMSGVPKEGEQLQLYIEQADAALYFAKNTGRNKMVHYLDMPCE